MDINYFLEKRNGSRLKPKSLNKENPELYNIIINFAKENCLEVDFKELVYLYVNELKIVPKCKICDNNTSFDRLSSGYRMYCSKSCKSSDIEVKDKIKQTFIKKYGGHPMRNETIKEKIKTTNLEKYGHTSHLSSDIIKNKIELTNTERYGVKRPLSSSKILDKTKETMLKLYGVEHGLQLDYVHKKTVNNRGENFNRENFLERIKKTKKEKYGDKNYNNIEQTKKTLLSRYNVDNILKDKSIREIISKKKLNNVINNYKHGSTIKLLDFGEDFCKIHCDVCDGESEMNRHFFTMRGISGKILCLNCNPYGNKYSSSEKELETFLNGKNYIKNERNTLSGLELDFYLPDNNLAIEYDGLYWHSELYKDKNYHLNKTVSCKTKGIDLLHVFEDEWVHKPEIVKSIINSRLGVSSKKFYARKCEIKLIDSKTSKEFLNENHIQGGVNSKVNIGLYYNDVLISLMTFGSKRISLGSKNETGSWELLRYCNKINTQVIGAASKLFKFFINNYKPNKITSYSDNRYFTGEIYPLLGFKFVSNTTPSYYYVIKDKKYHRYNFRKDKLIKDGFDPNKTEKQIMLERKIYRIYDCGNKKWEWSNK